MIVHLFMGIVLRWKICIQFMYTKKHSGYLISVSRNMGDGFMNSEVNNNDADFTSYSTK